MDNINLKWLVICVLTLIFLMFVGACTRVDQVFPTLSLIKKV
jgi:hypothetical protein